MQNTFINSINFLGHLFSSLLLFTWNYWNNAMVHNLYVWGILMYSLLNEQEMKFYFSRSQTPAPTHVMCQLLVLCWSCYQQRHNELVTSLRRPHAPNSANIRHEGCEIKIPFPLCWILLDAARPTWKDQIGGGPAPAQYPPILVLARHGGCGRINAAAVFILCHNLESNKICCKLMISFRFTPLLRSVKVKSDIFRTV